MLICCVALALAALMAKLWPETPFGKWLNEVLVVRSLDLISRLERKHVLFLIVGLIAIQASAIAAPLDLAFVAAWDATIYIDVVITVWTVSTVARGHTALNWVKAVAARLPLLKVVRRARQIRTRVAKSDVRPSASNDDDGPAWPQWVACAA